LFAVANAALAEAAYRGIVLDALDTAFGPGVAATVLQASPSPLFVSEAAFHEVLSASGLPLVYGLALGGLRRKAGGLVAPWVVSWGPICGAACRALGTPRD
jgi:hypothetical protein